MGIKGLGAGREALWPGIGHDLRALLVVAHHHEQHAEVPLKFGDVQRHVQRHGVGRDFDCLRVVDVGEVGLVLVVHLRGPLGVGIVKEHGVSPGDHDRLMAGLGKIQRRLPAGVSAADHHHLVPKLLLPAEHVLRQPYLRVVRPLHRDPLGSGAHGCDDHVVALVPEQLRRGGGVQKNRCAGLHDLPDHPVLVVLQVPLEADVIGEFQLSAQPVGGLIQRHGVALLHGKQRRPEPRGPAAENGHVLFLSGRGEHPVQHVMVARVGVHRTEGAVTAVAQQAGGQILASPLFDLVDVVFVADQGTGHADAVSLALGNEPVDEIRIPEPAHR